MSFSARFTMSFLLAALLPLQAGQIPEADPWSQTYRLEAQKDYTQAAAVIASQRDTSEFAQLRWAYLYYLQGQYDAALQGYQAAYRMNPQSLDALLGMTLPLMAQKRWSEAANKAQQVLDASPWHYTALLRLIICEEAQALWFTMANHAQGLARRYPSDASAVCYWARGEARNGRTAEATWAYQRLLQLYPGHQEALAYLKSSAK
jgi:tetratricopeptide (TPR) repeat protein